MNTNYNNYILVADSNKEQRTSFYKLTYLHLAASIIAFMIVEWALLSYVPESIQNMFLIKLSETPQLWLAVLGVFWLMSFLSNKIAFAQNRGLQYAGLSIYIMAEAFIFMPLLYIATHLIPEGEQIIQQAAIITLSMFAGLTAIVFITNKDFSYLKSALIIGGFISLGLIAASSLIAGMNLGLWFSVGMVVLAGGSILFQTSQIKYHFSTNQYVGASLLLFASIMLIFWYIIQILMKLKNKD